MFPEFGAPLPHGITREMRSTPAGGDQLPDVTAEHDVQRLRISEVEAASPGQQQLAGRRGHLLDDGNAKARSGQSPPPP